MFLQWGHSLAQNIIFFFILFSPYKEPAPAFSLLFISVVSEEIARADKLEILLEVFSDQPAGTVLEAMILLVVEDPFQKHADLFLIRVHLKLVVFNKFIDCLQEFVFVEVDL